MSECFFAPCPRGLEAALSDELVRLGASKIVATDGGVSFEGDLALAMHANLESRLARPEVDGRQLGEKIELQPRCIAEGSRDRRKRIARRINRRLQIDGRDGLELRAGRCLLQRCDERVVYVTLSGSPLL